MSYITIPRLAFSGNFQADVSTVNNDVRHYDNATFKPRYQLPQTTNEANGWYNPEGTGNFRLFGLQVHEALAAPGADSSSEPANGLFVNAQSKRSSCKIVDLDPQMQVVSTLFGLRIVLTDGTNDYLSGDYEASPFRDMSNGRAYPASALFMSVLSNLEWTKHAEASPTLVALKAAADANDGKLSINLTTYNYGANQEGNVVGSIGAYDKGDPDTFMAGRRLVNDSGANARVWLGDMMADQAGSTLSFDFSNSINLRRDLSIIDIGDLYGAILKQTDTVTGLGTDSASITVGVVNGDLLSSSDLKLLDQINYKDPDFLNTAAGLADCSLDEEAQALIQDHPVAIVRDNGSNQYEVVIRETNGGIYARADNFVLRTDPPIQGAANEVVNFKVTQWGKPVEGVKLVTTPLGSNVTGNYWGTGGSGPTDPTAPYPNINTPASAISVSTGIATGADGWAECPIAVTNPGNPRGYVEGQIYTISYHVAVGNASSQTPFDLIVIHAREAQNYPDPPPWSDIEPFMQQYDNLYPIMSKHLFSLSDPAVFEEHATLLTLAFSRPIDDPNHMPATRDLSASKRRAVLNWLAQYTGQPAPEFTPAMKVTSISQVVSPDVSHLPKPQPASTKGMEAMLASIDDDSLGKNPVMRNFLTSEIARLNEEAQS